MTGRACKVLCYADKKTGSEGAKSGAVVFLIDSTIRPVVEGGSYDPSLRQDFDPSATPG